MGTITGSGQAAVSSNARSAALEATEMALAPLGAARPTFGFLFASPKLALDECLTAAREVSKARLIGCTTAGEFTERGLTHGGVAVMLVAPDGILTTSASAAGVKRDPQAAAATLCAGHPEAYREAAKRGLAYATTVALVDGLAGTGETLVEAIVSQTGAIQQVAGGAAGDEGAFAATYVGGDDGSRTDAAAVMHVFGRRPWGIGVGHGLRPTTHKMRVTRADANVVYELDGRPAWSVYVDHAKKRGVTLSPATAGDYLIGNELGILVGDDVVRARAPLSVGSDGSLTCAAAIPHGASVAILDGDADNMVAAAKSAATEALANLEGNKPAGVLIFDCICRGMILKDAFMREVAAVREVLGDVPTAGFLTYGEIANYRGKLDGWHNTTAVVVAIPG
jgi:hypothetical protein